MGLAALLLIAVALVIAAVTAGVIWRTQHPPRRTLAAALVSGLPADPGEMGLRFTDVTLRLDDGSQSPGWIITGQNASGPTVIIAHGWGDSRYGALAVVPHLLPYASRLVLYDARAHGDSTARRCTMGCDEAMDVQRVIEQTALADRTNPASRVVLFGYSMGAGDVIGEAADDETGLVVGVIAEAPFRRVRDPIEGIFRLNRWPRFPVVDLVSLHFRFWNEPRGPYDNAKEAAKLKVPLLVLHGREDPICPLACGEAIAKAAPHGRLIEFPGGTHLDLAMRDPERYQTAIRDFLADLMKPRGNMPVSGLLPTRNSPGRTVE